MNPPQMQLIFDEKTIHDKKKDKFVLLCDGTGRIVFAHGDPGIFEMRPSKMIQRNLFSLGFTIHSLLRVACEHPNGILNAPSRPNITLVMQLVRRKQLMQHHEKEPKWKDLKHYGLKLLRLTCTNIKAIFSQQEVRCRRCEVRKEHPIFPSENDMEEDLVLVEVAEVEPTAIRQSLTSSTDYHYVRQKIMEEMNHERL